MVTVVVLGSLVEANLEVQGLEACLETVACLGLQVVVSVLLDQVGGLATNQEDVEGAHQEL